MSWFRRKQIASDIAPDAEEKQRQHLKKNRDCRRLRHMDHARRTKLSDMDLKNKAERAGRCKHSLKADAEQMYSTIERHCLLRKAVSYQDPPQRILLNIKPPAMDSLRKGADFAQLQRRKRTLDCYADLCLKSLKLVEVISTQLLELLKRIIQQYMIVVYQHCRSELNKELRQDSNYPNVKMEEVEKAIGLPLHPNQLFAQGWIDKTIFDIAYNAIMLLAKRKGCRLGPGFDTILFGDDDATIGLNDFLSFPRDFALKTICIDTEGRIVGTSCVRWPYWKEIDAFEKTVRDAKMGEKIRHEAQLAQHIIGGILDDYKHTSNAGLVQMGRNALTAYVCFRGAGNNCQWEALDSMNLRNKDQCPSCQVMFPEVNLIIPNAVVPKQKLGENRDLDRPWQCAEMDAWAQAVDSAVLPELRGGSQRRRMTLPSWLLL